VSEPYVVREQADQRNAVSNQHRNARDDESLDEPRAQEVLDGDAAVDIVPHRCSTVAPETADKSIAKGCRPITNKSTLVPTKTDAFMRPPAVTRSSWTARQT
jgi:hypothetical protein